MIRDALLAQEAAAIGGDEDVVLDADAAKVLVGLQFVKVEELGAVAAGTPVVDQGWNEVDARLVGHHKALLQTAAHAQGVGAELVQTGPGLLVKADVDLPQAFHVMHIHTHHVAQAVRQEHGMRSCGNSLVHIALHQA